MNRYILAFAALLVVAAAATKGQKCPRVTAKYPFDNTKFAGDWNVIAYLPNDKFGPNKCTTANITYLKSENGTTMNCKFNNFMNGKIRTGESISYCNGEDTGAITYSVYKWGDTNYSNDVYKKYIVATDYDTYALNVACRTTFDEVTKEFGRELYASIFSREKTMSDYTVKILKSILTSYDIEYDSLKKIEHNC